MAKSLSVIAATGILVAGSCLYATPYISINQFREAIAARDLPGIERHVDFPSLRASLKEQLKAKMAEEITKQTGGNPLVNFGMSAFGYALAEPMIDATVDSYISAAGFKALMAGSAPQKADGGAEPGSSEQPSGASSADAAVSMAYKTPNLFVVTASDASQPGSSKAVRFNFERHELVNWKLTSVSLP